MIQLTAIETEKSFSSRARLIELRRAADLAERALQDNEGTNRRFWDRWERAYQYRDSDDEDDDETESQKGNQFEEDEREPGFDWDARGEQVDAEEYRLRVLVTEVYNALLSEWHMYYREHYAQSMVQFHAAMKSRLPIELRNMVYHHLCRNPRNQSISIGQTRPNPNFQSFHPESEIDANWDHAQKALDASTRDVHKPGGWLLNPEYVGHDMAREAAEVCYSINEFWVPHEYLSDFLTQDRTQTGLKPYEYVRGALSVSISTTCGNGDLERAWSSSEHEMEFLNGIYTNLNALTLLTWKEHLDIHVTLSTAAPLRATRYNGERRFYNIMEAVRTPIYDLIHSGFKLEVMHLRWSDYSRRIITEGGANYFKMNRTAWEDEKAREGRGPNWLPTENYISRELRDEINEGELTRRLVERWNHTRPIDTY